MVGSDGEFDILFVGLVCFLRDARIAMMPDGRIPPENVEVHTPYLVVNPDAVITASGWDDNDYEDTQDGIYKLPKCRIEIRDATTPGRLEASQHDQFVPKLADADPEVKIDPNDANYVVRFQLGSGTLEALRRPDAEPEDRNVAIISRLRVQHEGPIVVEVNEEEGYRRLRILALAPGTDIALANIAYPEAPNKTGDHFAIYGQLTLSRTIQGPPPPAAPKVPRLKPDHQIFKLEITIGDGMAACGTQGYTSS